MIGIFQGFAAIFDHVKKGQLVSRGLSQALGIFGFMVFTSMLIMTSFVSSRVHVAMIPPPSVWLVSPPAFHAKPHANRVQTLDSPSLSTVKVQNWATRSLREIFSFNFVNYAQHLDDTSLFFTDTAWPAFRSAFISSKVATRVASQQLEVYLVPLAAARVTNISMVNGHIIYRIQMSALMVYRSPSDTKTNTVRIDAIINQVPTIDNPDGIGFTQLMLQPEH